MFVRAIRANSFRPAPWGRKRYFAPLPVLSILLLATVANGRLAGATTIPDDTAINEHPCDPGGGFATATTYFTLCPSPAAYRLFALDGSEALTPVFDDLNRYQWLPTEEAR